MHGSNGYGASPRELGRDTPMQADLPLDAAFILPTIVRPRRLFLDSVELHAAGNQALVYLKRVGPNRWDVWDVFKRRGGRFRNRQAAVRYMRDEMGTTIRIVELPSGTPFAPSLITSAEIGRG